MWGATAGDYLYSIALPFQLTHPMWGATKSDGGLYPGIMISTHTPHVGCDLLLERRIPTVHNFNSHTPCGVRQHCTGNRNSDQKFQLTHPMWGATGEQERNHPYQTEFQLTHPMWGATRRPCSLLPPFLLFQLTHPMWGATQDNVFYDGITIFQLTHPMWGATSISSSHRNGNL